MRYLAAALMTLTLALPALAARLDDSLSPRQEIDVMIDWQYHGNLENLDEQQLNALSSTARNVEVRLNTTQYIGRQARIYLSLPLVIRGLDDPAALRLSWTTHGVFSDGTAIPGSRALLFDGVIDSEVMVDILDFTIDVDGRSFNEPINFEPVYEIEPVTP
jgi:hypothetical protein